MAVCCLSHDRLTRGLALLPVVLLLLSACTSGSGGAASQTATSGPKSLTVQLVNAGGKNVATAVITEGLTPDMASARMASAVRRSPAAPTGVTVAIDVTDLPAGTHGFHVHSVGRCDRPEFASAGPHLNPDNRTHGVMSSRGPHAGDLPNLTVDKDRTALAAFFVGHLTMSQIESSPNGASLLIDAAPDDNTTDPDGGSGKHIACGVIRPGTAGSASATPTAAATSAATRNVTFTELHMGTFPVHLHSACNGSQSFHIAVLGNLMVNSSGTGTIAVAAGDFGRGWCLIVYSDPSLQAAAAMRAI
jgi:superoxide dismutase, Cu-Zn family